MVSSQRFKDEVKPMEQASEAIYRLMPVRFRYKREIDPTRPLGFGLIAEQVEKVSPDLVTRGNDGKVSSVRYDAVNAMVLNEFLKEHRKVEQQDCKIQEQGATIAELRSTSENQKVAIAMQQKQIQTLNATLEQQAAQLQKVTAQIELNPPRPRQVALEIYK
jgi:Chaperone of endosialidase